MTFVLKEPRVLTTGGSGAARSQDFMFPSVKEFSFEVEDKAAIKNLILDATMQ